MSGFPVQGPGWRTLSSKLGRQHAVCLVSPVRVPYEIMCFFSKLKMLKQAAGRPIAWVQLSELRREFEPRPALYFLHLI